MNKDFDIFRPLIYLASPYTHQDPKLMHKRFVQISNLAGRLLKKGYHVLCPISSSVPIAKYGHVKSTKWKAWADLDLNYLGRCDEIWITALDKEWINSVGMYHELKFAMESGYHKVRLVNRHGQLLSENSEYILSRFKINREDK